MKAKITKTTVDELRTGAQTAHKTIYCWDTELPGFGVLATAAGAVSYFIEYRLGGRGTPTKRLTIAKHGHKTPSEARALAKIELGKVAGGLDVAQAKKDQQAKLTGATFRDLIERYLAIHGKDTRYWKEKRARLLSSDLKVLHSKSATLITRAEIAAAIDKVQTRSHAAARLLFADIRPIFAWAFNRAAVEANPVAGLTGPRPLGARDRVLSDEEIVAFWQAVSEESWPFQNVFKLLLLTGQRREEVAGMRWRELDCVSATWVIAKERCKNGRAHSLDLSPEALALLDPLGGRAWPRQPGSSNELVFSTTGKTPVSGFSRAKARIDARMSQILGSMFQPWRTHDLRRTAASGMAALGVLPHIIERVLNHVSGAQGGLIGVYQRYEYREERKRALLAWNAHVTGIVRNSEAPSKVA